MKAIIVSRFDNFTIVARVVGEQFAHKISMQIV